MTSSRHCSQNARHAAADIEQPPLQLRMTNNRNCNHGCRTAATAEVGRCCWRKAPLYCRHSCQYHWTLTMAWLIRNGGHDTFHVFLQVQETHFLLLRWSGGPEVRAVPRIGSDCQPLLFSQVRDAALELLASLSAFKDDCLPCAAEVPTDVDVLCLAIALELIQWVGLWHRHSATAKFVEKPSREPRNVIDTQPQRVRAQGKQSDPMLFRRPAWVGCRPVL